MALTGDAFLAMWHDIEPLAQDEYMEWHTREHMPERLSILGFTVGKRLINHDLTHYRYGTIYAGETVEVFRSRAYLERLNNPTDWSLEVQPSFRNFLRVACQRLASSGAGNGGAMATTRLNFLAGASKENLKVEAQILADVLLKITGVCCVHIGLADAEVSDIKTREGELRPEMNERAFDVVIIIEGSGLPELTKVVPQIEAAIKASNCGLGEATTLVYNLAYQLTSEDMCSTSAG